MQELKKGSSAERIAKMRPGKERDHRVVWLEDKGQLTTWQGRKGRERLISSTRSESGMGPGSPEGRLLERTRSTSASASRPSSVKWQSSPSSSPRGSKASRTTLDPVAQDKNRNGLPSGRENDSDWAN